MSGARNPRPTSKAVAFGYKTAWYAVKGLAPKAIAKMLRAEWAGSKGTISETSWKEGVAAGYSGSFFVTPATDSGWVLAMSVTACQELSSLRDVLSTLRRVEAEEVQFFATDRVTGLATWAKARKGKVMRAWFSVDGNPEEEGEILSGEPEQPDDDEDTVMAVAAAWSINPQKVSREVWATASGLVVPLGS